MIHKLNFNNKLVTKQRHNKIYKKLIKNKLDEINQYRVTYEQPPAFGKAKPGFTTVPSITEMQDNLQALYKLLFDEQDEHVGLIDEIEELLEKIK